MTSSDFLDVALVNMPFASIRQPSFALGLLASSIRGKYKVKTFDFNVDFAEIIGLDLYDEISTWHIVDLLGDRLFAQDLYGSLIPPFEEYVERILKGKAQEHEAPFEKRLVDETFYDGLVEVQSAVGPFLEKCLQAIAEANPKVVAFTSMFHQQVAALSLAKRIKDVFSRTLIVFGGANCKNVMGEELLRCHPFVDAVCLGEGDSAFKSLVDAYMSDQSLDDIDEILGMALQKNIEGKVSLESDLNSVPMPDYSDYASLYEQSEFMGQVRARIFFEMSRGCYWGQRKRCIFCGQSSETLRFRKKSRGRIISEVRSLVSDYPGFCLSLSDESCDAEMLDSLMEALAMFDRKPEIVYLQVRPDIDMISIKKLAECGLKRVEAGIESLSSKVLSIIGKGVSALQNIAFLKGCREAKITPVWNFLWGFPGEPIEAYENMAKIMPLLSHLPPPNYAGPFRLDRFSPCFEDPERYGIKRIRPYPSYAFTYPFGEKATNNLASFFTFEYQIPQNCAEYAHELRENIFFWKEIHPKSSLCFSRDEEGLIIDKRSGEGEWHIRLDPLTLAVCKACSKPMTIEAIALSLSEKGFVEDENKIKQSIINLIKYGIVLKEGKMLLSLVTKEEVMP